MDWMSMLNGTPLWVYILFGYIMWIGLNALRAHVITLQRLWIMPFLFTLLSLDTLVGCMNSHAWAFLVWLSCLSIGFFLSWKFFSRWAVMVEADGWKLRVPGSVAPLILLLLIFSTKYYFGFVKATDPQRVMDPEFQLMLLIISAGSTGLLLGRCALYAYRMYQGQGSLRL